MRNENLQLDADFTRESYRADSTLPPAEPLPATTTAFGTLLVSATDAAAARSALLLGTMATQNAGGVSITGGNISGITDLAVADGGTGASTAANARTNLGLGTMAVTNAVAAVADLNQTISATPTQAEVQALSDKVDELLAAMRTASHMAP